MTYTNIQKTICYTGIFGVIFFLPLSLFAESSCSIEPFVTTVKQGEGAQMMVVLKDVENNIPFDLALGDLPKSVESGFLKIENIETVGNTKKVPLILQTKKDAQIGSFMISVIYKTSPIDEVICQFNLEVKKNSSVVPQTIVQSLEITTHSLSSGPFLSATSTNTQSIVTSDQKEEKSSIKKAKNSSNKEGYFTKRLSLRSSGEEVKRLQKTLKSLGLYPANEPITGYFGPITEYATKEFQKSKNLEMVGVVGPKTRKILEEIYK